MEKMNFNKVLQSSVKSIPIMIGIYLIVYSFFGIDLFHNEEDTSQNDVTVTEVTTTNMEVPPTAASLSIEETEESDVLNAKNFIDKYEDYSLDEIYDKAHEQPIEVQKILFNKEDVKQHSIIGMGTYIEGTVLKKNDKIISFITDSKFEWLVHLEDIDDDLILNEKYRVTGHIFYSKKYHVYYLSALDIIKIEKN